MKFTHKPQFLWFEDKNGNKLNWNPDFVKGYETPKGAYFQVSQFPCVLTTKYLRLNDDGSSTEIFASNASYPEDLVLAMANSKDFTLSEAIIIAAHSCERCMNSLADKYGLPWGYPEFSEEWQKTNTICDYCRDDGPLWKRIKQKFRSLYWELKAKYFPNRRLLSSLEPCYVVEENPEP